MFLALIIPAFLSPCLSPVNCEVESSGNSSVSNGSFTYTNVITPTALVPSSKINLLQLKYPELRALLTPSDIPRVYKNATGKYLLIDFSHRGPARMPSVQSEDQDYGKSSHYRMKGSGRDSKKTSLYRNLIQKLLRPRSSYSSKKQYNRGNSNKYSAAIQPMSAEALSAPVGWGWGGGWGWGKAGGGGGHGYGVSLVDLLLGGLSLLSLGGFLLNLLLNLLNLFGYGFMTSTATYPVTVTQTATATGTSTSTGTGGGGTIILPTAPAISSLATSGWGITSRNLNSVADAVPNGWGWKPTLGWGWPGNVGRVKVNVQLPMGGWTTTTTTTTTTPFPTITGTVTGTGGTAFALRPLVPGRRKRETFQPYVSPSTALDIFAKAVLNSIDAATNKFECMERIHCENNRQARVVGDWLDYFMPVYSFSLSFVGHRMGAHDSLLDQIRAIVLGATETNCQTHFPRCGRTRPDLV